MLKQLFPRNHQHYSSLPLLGPMLDKFAVFLVTDLGYAKSTVRCHIHMMKAINFQLQLKNCLNISDISIALLNECITSLNINKSCIILQTEKLLKRYLINAEIISYKESASLIKIKTEIVLYSTYLNNVRGLAPDTIKSYSAIATKFLIAFNEISNLSQLVKLTSQNIENYICIVSPKVTRRTLSNVITSLRLFLRYLAAKGKVPTGLDARIDTPLVYREEQLPRALDWDTVQAFLLSIDRSTSTGKRDYAMLLLIATYGLRAGEVARLKLDDIEWKTRSIKIFQTKTSSFLLLPLIDNVAESIISYISQGRPDVDNREIFVKHTEPIGILKPSYISYVFNYWAKLCKLSIKFKGVHCLRHSFATNLLRKGAPLKTIGDLLGHKSFRSTCVYLRLNIEDMRAVPLSIPILPQSINGVQQ